VNGHVRSGGVPVGCACGWTAGTADGWDGLAEWYVHVGILPASRVVAETRFRESNVKDAATTETVIEWCRECRDEREWLAPGVPAEFVLWGKFFPPEALGPRCYDHAALHIGSFNMGRIDQYAVLDLRQLTRSAEVGRG
jgi:hypothetical protein